MENPPRVSGPRRSGTGLHFLEPFSGKNEQHKYLNKAKTLVTQPMLQRRPNHMELRSMDPNFMYIPKM